MKQSKSFFIWPQIYILPLVVQALLMPTVIWWIQVLCGCVCGVAAVIVSRRFLAEAGPGRGTPNVRIGTTLRVGLVWAAIFVALYFIGIEPVVFASYCGVMLGCTVACSLV